MLKSWFKWQLFSLIIAGECDGAIYGNRIQITAPGVSQKTFSTTRGSLPTFCKRLRMVKAFFWDVCVGYPGSVHDARVLQQLHHSA